MDRMLQTVRTIGLVHPLDFGFHRGDHCLVFCSAGAPPGKKGVHSRGCRASVDSYLLGGPPATRQRPHANGT